MLPVGVDSLRRGVGWLSRFPRECDEHIWEPNRHTRAFVNTSELLRDFAWFLDNAEDSHVAEAAELLAHYRKQPDDSLFGASFTVFALSGKYENDKERKLRMGLALASNDLAQEGGESEVAFLLEALKRAGWCQRSWEPEIEKKPIWLAWIDAMDELEVLKDAVPDDLRRQAFAQAAALFAKDQPIELIEKVHGELSHQLGVASGRVPDVSAAH